MCLISNKGVLPFSLHAYGFVYLSECLLFSCCRETTVGLFVADVLVCSCSRQCFISQTLPPSLSLSGLLFGIAEATQLGLCIIAAQLLVCLFDPAPVPLIEWGDGGGKTSCFSHHVFMHCDLGVPVVENLFIEQLCQDAKRVIWWGSSIHIMSPDDAFSEIALCN